METMGLGGINGTLGLVKGIEKEKAKEKE